MNYLLNKKQNKVKLTTFNYFLPISFECYFLPIIINYIFFFFKTTKELYKKNAKFLNLVFNSSNNLKMFIKLNYFNYYSSVGTVLNFFKQTSKSLKKSFKLMNFFFFLFILKLKRLLSLNYINSLWKVYYFFSPNFTFLRSVFFFLKKAGYFLPCLVFFFVKKNFNFVKIKSKKSIKKRLTKKFFKTFNSLSI